jgi:hypothetical protein
MAGKAKAALDAEALTVIADPGYYTGQEIVDCYAAGITALVPKVDTSGNQAKGRYSKADFRYDSERDEYVCPAGQRLTYRFNSEESGRTLRVYMAAPQCAVCPQLTKCTTGHARRIRRWEHEQVLEAAQAELDKHPEAMRQRKQIVEHPYATIKLWMGSPHFLMKGLPNVQAEMSLHVLAYNFRRAINILGVTRIMEQLQAA